MGLLKTRCPFMYRNVLWFLILVGNLFLVSTYVVCERLSVVYQSARLPENFDQISPEHPCSGIWHRTPPLPKIKIFPRVQVRSYLEHPPRKWKTLTFFPEFRSELTQNTPPNEKIYLSFLSSDLSLCRTPPPSENEKL